MKTSLPADCMSWCIVADCPDLGPLEHGNYINVSNYRHGNTVTFTCDEGYRLVGMNTSTCEDFKTWSTPVPVCEEVKVFVSAGWRNATIVQAPFIVILLIILILMVYYIVRLRMRQSPKDEESAVNGAALNADKSAVGSVVEQKETDTRSYSLKSNSSEDSGIESSRESRTVSEERGGAIGRGLDTERDTLSGRDTHGPPSRGAASEPNIDQDGGIGSAPSTKRAESEPNRESHPRTRSCHAGERHSGESDTGDGVPYTYNIIDNSTTVSSVAFHVNSNNIDIRETLNYKSGDRNSSSVAYKSNNDSNNVRSNNTENDKDNVGPRKSETAAAPNDASSCTGRNSPQTGSVDLARAAKNQVPADDIKFGTPESNLTKCQQPEEQGGPSELITNSEKCYHSKSSPTQLNVQLSDASAALGDNATDPDNSERDPLLTR
ncbi:hypothetical protein MAR_007006 [Mya arenaria]|uniref:Sushi domain-containing protein n=1 Tax=Mya arenaria TaxID=6604 RepID=A0ABY7DHQ6_MYAAR|nr:hypothetical protein MAR_007006 [Mya arenaria]